MFPLRAGQAAACTRPLVVRFLGLLLQLSPFTRGFESVSPLLSSLVESSLRGGGVGEAVSFGAPWLRALHLTGASSEA